MVFLPKEVSAPRETWQQNSSIQGSSGGPRTKEKYSGRDRDRTGDPLLVLQCAKKIGQSSDQANDET